MEKVMWFFADEHFNILTEMMMEIDAKEQVIELLKRKVTPGEYHLGYFKRNGTQKVFEEKILV